MRKPFSLEDKYKCIADFDLSNEQIDKILYYFYLPIMGSESVLFYKFLFIESKNTIINDIYFSHERIVSSLKIKPENIGDIITTLEKNKLLTIFANEKNSNELTYLLSKPLSVKHIIKDKAHVTSIIGNIDEINFDINKSYLTNKKFSLTENLINITKEEDLTDLLGVDTPLDFLNELVYKNNNFKIFFSRKHPRKMLEKIYTIFESPLTIFIKSLTKSLKNLSDDKQPNWNLLIELLTDSLDVKQYKTKESIIKNNLPPSFIKQKLNRYMTLEEMDFIYKLYDDLGFSMSSINLLIDFSFIKNNDKLVIPYLNKISKSLSDYQIISFDNIKLYLKKAYDATETTEELNLNEGNSETKKWKDENLNIKIDKK